jgi:hypothetical protein
MGVNRIKNGYLAKHYWGKKHPIQEYFYDKDYGSSDSANAAAERWLARIALEFPAPEKKTGKPFMSDGHTVAGGTPRRVPCIYVYWIDPETRKQKNKKFLYHNDIDKLDAERRAKPFLEARIKEWENDEVTV